MKWDLPNGSVQWSADRKYCIVQANERDWIAYAMRPTTGDELAVKPTDTAARQVCEDHAVIHASLTRKQA